MNNRTKSDFSKYQDSFTGEIMTDPVEVEFNNDQITLDKKNVPGDVLFKELPILKKEIFEWQRKQNIEDSSTKLKELKEISKPVKRDYDYGFSIKLIGDRAAGKSCLLLRFADNYFTDSFISTIGVPFRFKTITVNEKIVRLQVFDTEKCDKESSHDNPERTVRGYADIIFYVYDITSKESFNYIRDIIDKHQNSDRCMSVLVGQKCDIEDDRNVPYKVAGLYALEKGISFFEVSAKESTNVEKLFSTATALFFKKLNLEKKPSLSSNRNTLIKPKSGNITDSTTNNYEKVDKGYSCSIM